MRIHTLGTSHGTATYNRENSCTAVAIDGKFYLVDAGEPAAAMVMRAGFDWADLVAIMVTHMHADHTGGLPQVVKEAIKRAPDAPEMLVYLPYGPAIEAIDAWMLAQCHKGWPSARICFETTRVGRIHETDAIAIEAIETQHLIHPDGSPSYAYELAADGKRVLFTGDLLGDFSDFPAVAKTEPFDLVVCEMTHFQPEQAVPILKHCPIKRMVFNHIHDPWHGDGEAVLTEKLSELPFEFAIAHDGDVYEL